MRWILATALILAAAPAYGQDKEAEKLYGEFEKKVADAKAIKVSFETEADSQPAGAIKVKGDFTLAAGNRLKLSFEGSIVGQAISATMISNGKRMAMQVSAAGAKQPDPKDTPNQLTAGFTALLPRCGVFVGMNVAMSQPELAEKLKPAGIKLGAKEKIGDREAQVVEFTLELPAALGGGQGQAVCKLWLDAKTKLPLKRSTESNQGGVVQRVVEVYSNWQLDPRLREDEFVLPK